MRVFDQYLIEMSVAFNFNTFETMSIEDFLEKEKQAGNIVALDIKDSKKLVKEATIADAESEPYDTDPLIKQKHANIVSQKIDAAKRPDKMIHRSQIVDEKGNIIDTKVLMNKIMQRPVKLISQNAKIKKSGDKIKTFYDITLPSYMGLYVDETTKEFRVVKTCPSAGECTKFCYAARGLYLVNPLSSLASSRVVNYLMNDSDEFKAQLISELTSAIRSAKKKNMSVVLRWHDSGDFLSESYLQLAYDVARETPNILHYAYTKQIPLIKKMEEYKPGNFVFNFSFGGIHDEEIDPLVDKHARVVPKNLFKDLPFTKTEEGIIFTPEALNMLKNRVANTYKINNKTILSYDDLKDLPLNKKKKWNVLVWKGHGDDAATRSDVLGTYLLIH